MLDKEKLPVDRGSLRVNQIGRMMQRNCSLVYDLMSEVIENS